MSWQDVILSSGIIIFNLALIPSLISKHKPALATSLTTGVILLVFVVTYLTIPLWFAAAATLLNAILWLVLAAQQWNRHHRTSA